MSPASNTQAAPVTEKLRVSVIREGKGPVRAFWRGGVYVTGEDQDVEVTPEEAERLRGDSLLRVRGLPISAQVDVHSGDAKAALREAGRTKSVELPPDDADRVQLIQWAINSLDPKAEGAWTADKKPQVDDINAALAEIERLPEDRITAKERDGVWGSMGFRQALNNDSEG